MNASRDEIGTCEEDGFAAKVTGTGESCTGGDRVEPRAADEAPRAVRLVDRRRVTIFELKNGGITGEAQGRQFDRKKDSDQRDNGGDGGGSYR